MARAHPTDTAATADEAATWFARLRDPALSDAERVAFADWLQQQPDHAAAMQEMGAIWDSLNTLPDPRRTEIAPAPQRVLSRRHVLVGAGLSALAGAVGWSQWRIGDVATERGEHRRVIFAANASLELDSLSAIDMAPGEPHPMAELRKGQMFVTTERAAGAEVILRLPFGRVQAATASFNLKLERRRALVAVESGRVLVRRQSGGALEMGPNTELALGPVLVEQPRVLPAYRIAPWRDGWLIFDRALLVDVVDDINRHRAGRVLIGDPRLDDLLVTGTFKSDGGDAALLAIAETFSLKSLNFGSALTVLISA
ncbi:MAG: DUF4880 domain-containing protein [Rhodospirillaceae bacterium]|nr:DUF4880 domain-containing protein [Rhodospirillaceae bacterium]